MLILCVVGWIRIPGDVTAVGTVGGVRIGNGSGRAVTTRIALINSLTADELRQ